MNTENHLMQQETEPFDYFFYRTVRTRSFLNRLRWQTSANERKMRETLIRSGQGWLVGIVCRVGGLTSRQP